MRLEVRWRGRQRPWLVILLPLLALGANGCWDYKEPNRLAFVEALAVDRGPDGSVEVAVLVAIPSAQAGGGGGGGRSGGSPTLPAMLATSRGRTMAEAMLNMNRFTSRTLTVSQCRAVLFSAEVAREGLAPYIGILSRWYEFRSTMMVFVTKGRADECLKIESPLERDPTQFLVKLATTAPEFGLGASFQVHDLLHQLGSYETEPVLPLIERRQPASAPRGGAAPAGDQGPPPATSGPGTSSIPPKEAVGLAGLAVLRTARMVGELSAQETAFYLMLTGRSLTSFLILPDPEVRGRFVTVQAKGIRRTIRVKRLFGPPEIAVSLEVPLELVEIQSTVDYTSRHLRGRLERTAEEQIERGCAAVVRRAQRELRADLFGWGSYVKNHFLTWPAWVEYDWLKRQFPQTRVEISVTARLRHPGSTFRPVRPVQAPGRPRRGPAGDVEVLQSLSVAPE